MGDAGGEPPWRPAVVGGRPRVQPEEPPSVGSDLTGDASLDRLLGDAELLYRLQLSNYAPQDWARPSEEFARYGFDVMVGWLVTGRIWAEVYKKTGRHLRRPEDPFDDDTVRTLASDTVVAALHAFLETVLKRNQWDPAKGASLKTYFVGQCCFQFSNVLRGHYRRLDREREIPYADPSQQMREVKPGADSELLERERLIDVLSSIANGKAREAFALQADGYTEAEIAELLGAADAKAIENMLGHQRRRARNLRQEGNTA